MKTTLIEKETTAGAYDFDTTAMILDTDTMGRILITDGWGGDDINGFCYRWKHGIAVQLKADDTFSTLAEPWNDMASIYQAVTNGYDEERPILVDFNGHAIAAIAKRHGN
jgi:hypothetical protein